MADKFAPASSTEAERISGYRLTLQITILYLVVATLCWLLACRVHKRRPMKEKISNESVSLLQDDDYSVVKIKH